MNLTAHNQMNLVILLGIQMDPIHCFAPFMIPIKGLNMIKGSLDRMKMQTRLHLHRLQALCVMCPLRTFYHVEKIKKSGMNSLGDLAEAGTYQAVLVMSMVKIAYHWIYPETLNMRNIGKKQWVTKIRLATRHVTTNLSKSHWLLDRAWVHVKMHLPIIQRTALKCKAPRMRRIS